MHRINICYNLVSIWSGLVFADRIGHHWPLEPVVASAVIGFPRGPAVARRISVASLDDFAAFLPEFRAQQAIDKDVGGAIEDQEKMAHTDRDHGPDRERMVASFAAQHGLANRDQLVNIE